MKEPAVVRSEPFSVARRPSWAGHWAAEFWPRSRVRRPLDIARLITSGAVLIIVLLLAVVQTTFLATAFEFVPVARPGLSRTVLSIVNAAVSLTVVGAMIAIIYDGIRWRRFALTSAAMACAIAVLAILAVALIGRLTSGDAVTDLLIAGPRRLAGLPVAAALAVVIGADVQRLGLLFLARLSLTAAVCCAVGLGVFSVPSAGFAVAVGVTAGLGVRVVFGVVPARPNDDAIRSALAAVEGEPITLRTLEEGAGIVRYAGARADGTALLVTVVDRDLRGVPLARRAWRLIRLRAAAVGHPALSLRGQLERQALCAGLARSAGVVVPEVVALLSVGQALMLVEEPLAGVPLAAAPPDAVRGGVVAAASALRRLHDVGLAHGALTADGVLLLPDGRTGFARLVAGQPAAGELQRELDVVALLVAATSRLSAADAVAAMKSGYGITALTEPRFAALLQPVALPRSARRLVRRTTILADLRTALVGSEPEVPLAAAPRLERMRPRTVISVAGGTLAAYLLATQLSQVSLAQAFRPSYPAWLMLALLGSGLTYLGSAVVKQAFVSAGLPLARTVLVQVASSFVSLVTPPAVGHVGLNIRYLHRAGIPTATAAAYVAVSEAVTVAVTVLMLLVFGWLSGASSAGLSLLPSGSVLIILLAVAGTVGLVFALPPSRRLLRRRLEPLLRRTLPQLIAAASDPRRLGTAVIGVLVLNGGYVLALDASLRAFNASISLPVLVVVYFAASTIASVAPTPGGLGAVEAALVAALSASGVPVAAALSGVLAFRVATFWLPAPIGWGAFVALQRRGRI